MGNQIKAPINYPIIAGGKIVAGGSVLFGQPNVKPDEDNPSTLKAIYLDAALSQPAQNPQGVSSDGVFDQSDNGVLYGPTDTVYSIVIKAANGAELSYIPEYDLNDANAAAAAQESATEAANSASSALTSKNLVEALYTDFNNRYFGSYSSNPSVDSLGNPPSEGSIYFNSISNVFFTWIDGAWANQFPSNPNGLLITATGGSAPKSLGDRFAETGITRNSIKDLQGLVGDYEGQQISIKGYHPDSDVGGGQFYYDANRSKADHDGGTVIDPDKTFPSDWDNSTQVDAWFTADGVGNGVWVRAGIISDINFSLFGGLDSNPAAVNSLIINKMIPFIEEKGGGFIDFQAGGDYKFIDRIELVETVGLRGVGGRERGLSIIRYVGTVFQDFITNKTGHRNYIKLENLFIAGGEFQQGRARYTVRFTQFNTRSHIKDCLIREGLGHLRIDSGFYSTIDNVECGRPVPRQDSPSIPFTNGEWGEVYSGDNAPIHLIEMNASQINKLKIATPTSENTTGVVPVQAVHITGEDPLITNMSIESVGESYDIYNPSCDIAIKIQIVGTIPSLYLEAVFVNTDLFNFYGYSRASVKGFTCYNVTSDTFVRNISVGDVEFADGQVWRADIRRLDFTNAAGSGSEQEGSDVIFNRVSFRSGTDNETQDTNNSIYKYGCIDGPFNDSQTSNRYIRFPRIIGGLGVTLGSDLDGAFCEVENGTFISQSGEKINCKALVKIGTFFANQKLRPNIASRYWRVNVGKAGNIYLTESDSPFIDPRGDWIVEFETDGSGNPINLSSNDRLTLDGFYTAGTSKAVISKASNGTPAFAGREEDIVNNTNAVTGVPTGWVYTSGSWVLRGTYP